MSHLEEQLNFLIKKIDGLEKIVEEQNRDVLTLSGLARVWRINNQTAETVLRFLVAKDIKIGVRHGRIWKINKQKALDIITSPIFEEALEVASYERTS